MALFYKCEECGTVLLAMGENPALCEKVGLKKLEHNIDESLKDKHQPLVSVEDGQVVVRVGRTPHPATEEDHIEWVYVETSSGGSFYNLHVGDEPKLTLPLEPSAVEAVYVYCDHCGLWKADNLLLSGGFESNDVACSPEFPTGCVNPSEN